MSLEHSSKRRRTSSSLAALDFMPFGTTFDGLVLQGYATRPMTSGSNNGGYLDPFHSPQRHLYSYAGPFYRPSPMSEEATPPGLHDDLPGLFPGIPLLHNRLVNANVPNPFLRKFHRRYRTNLPASHPQNIEESGYVKITRKSDAIAVVTEQQNRPSYLPTSFGRVLEAGDELDQHCLKFYIWGYCSGRTLLPRHNYWMHEVAAMVASSPCVKHAVLAMSAGYLLDYKPDNTMRQRANEHYTSAVYHLSQSLLSRETQDIDAGDETVAALMVLIADDLVHHELQRPSDRNPKWLRAARIANDILDSTDPAYLVNDPLNVQSSVVRTANANRIAFINILVESLTPLVPGAASKARYDWLLEGCRGRASNEYERQIQKQSRHDLARIHSGTGISPRLLFFFAQITSMTDQLTRNPHSTAYVRGMDHILKRLDAMVQWSDLTQEHDMVNDPLDMSRIEVDADGKVTSHRVLVDLIGWSWIQAIKMYAYCRFYRIPRSHRQIQDCLATLTACIEAMPFKGCLFTSQAPFFPIFFMGLMSRPGQRCRAVAEEWFETVTSISRSRSSVPPVYEALKATWLRMDSRPDQYDTPDTDASISSRHPWYEDLVQDIVEQHGVISLF